MPCGLGDPEAGAKKIPDRPGIAQDDAHAAQRHRAREEIAPVSSMFGGQGRGMQTARVRTVLPVGHVHWHGLPAGGRSLALAR